MICYPVGRPLMNPSDWNVVMLGAWNRAILTPAWISQTVFANAAEVPVNVLVPLDGTTPFQVEDQGITVVPIPGQLIIQLGAPNQETLARAMAAAQRAIQDLPRTPLRACGINLRYSAPEPPRALVSRTRCQTERILSDSGRELRTRRRGETLSFHEGSLNIITDIPTAGSCTVNFNFERQSTNRDDILAWLGRSASDYIVEATDIIHLIAEEGDA